MKKGLVALLAMVILSSTAVYASDTPISDWINSKTSKITEKKNRITKGCRKRKKRQEKIKNSRKNRLKQRKKQSSAKKNASKKLKPKNNN